MENGAAKDTTEEVKTAKPAEETKPEDTKSVVAKTEAKDTEATDAAPAAAEPMETENVKVEVNKDENEKPKDVKAEDVKTKDIKTEDTKKEETPEELAEKIKSQVEFYFGDVNLPRDKFLSEQTKLDDGWVPMTVMLNFKLLASMSKDHDVILKALEGSDLIEISEDRKKIRRSPNKPLPVFDEAYKKAQAERTVYVKGFPLTDIYVQKLKEFFKDYEPFENIILRKYQDKEKKLMFKGSIFIQFTTLEGAKAFMARESVKYGDTELIRKFSEDYAVEKAKEKEERKLKKGVKKETKTEENDKDGKVEEERDFPKGSILHFTGVKGETPREVIGPHIEKLGGVVAYIDYHMNDTEGFIRLQDENSGSAVLKEMKDNKLTIEKDEVTFRLLEGEEEETYLKTVKETMKNRQHKNKSPRRGRSRRGRGGGGQRGRKRNGSPARGAVPAKKSNAN